MADVESHIMPGITHWQHPRWDCSVDTPITWYEVVEVVEVVV